MAESSKDEELNLQIRKFLKQVGVGAHKIILEKFNGNNTSSCEVSVKLEIDNQELEKFNVIIKT